jgi:hypothetical protein
MNSDKTVTAIFEPAPPSTYNVSVSIVRGNGSISATGINCPSDCSEIYTDGSAVTLTASASSGFVFTGWHDSGGQCSGTGNCTITVSSDRTLRAAFSKVFTEDPIKAYNPTTGEYTYPKWEHITQLRDAVNDIRLLNNKSEYTSWPTHADDPNLFWGDYVTTLRDVIGSTASEIGKSVNSNWTDSDIPSDQIGVKAVHINELRRAIEDLRR